MRRLALLFMVLSSTAVARAAERTLSVEVELLGPKDKSIGKTQVLVAPRGSERAHGTFGALTLIIDADVGPTFDKDCNLVTLSGRLEEADPAGKPRKRELKRTTMNACGARTETTIPGGGDNRIVITVKPAS
jgi:hypothetical protein